MSDHVIVTTTTDSEESATALATGAVEVNLGACAQVTGPVTSVFRWEGEVRTEPEWRVDIKTAADRASDLTDYLRAKHAYDVPEVITTPITGGSTEYLAWVTAETR